MRSHAILLSVTVLISLQPLAFADDSPCVKALMSQPSCVNRVNAESFCSRTDDDEIVQRASGCVARMKSAGMNPESATAMCLGGFVRSSNEKANETLCN
jgi:hypothetical protein